MKIFEDPPSFGSKFFEDSFLFRVNCSDTPPPSLSGGGGKNVHNFTKNHVLACSFDMFSSTWTKIAKTKRLNPNNKAVKKLPIPVKVKSQILRGWGSFQMFIHALCLNFLFFRVSCMHFCCGERQTSGLFIN
jgi:hypothetical protein